MGSKGLGMGLDALFMTGEPSKKEEKNLSLVKLSQIEPNAAQPRKDFDAEALAELAESIRTHGILQPLAVRRLSEGRYQIIAGERRYRAAREAGLTEVPVYFVEADDRTVMELALVENLQRQDLNPIEEAEGYRVLMSEFSLTQEDCAARVGKSRPVVANALRLLSLPDEIRELLSEGKLSVGHAKTLLSLSDSKLQLKIAKLIVENGFSVRQTELLVKKALQEKKEKKVNSSVSVNYLEEIERRLSGKLGRKVKLISGRKKGKIELEFYNPEDLEKLINLLESL